jgi:hypothetical protein
MSGGQRGELILAIYPFSRGFSFTLFEGHMSLVNWGVKDIRGRRRTARSLESAIKIIERFQPDAIVMPMSADPLTRRPDRIQKLQHLIANHAQGQAIEVYRYGRAQIRDCFKTVGATSRYEIAQAIASQVHALGHRVPPVRKIWQSEDSRMGLFDAAALVMTYYCRGGERPSEYSEALQ